MKFKKGDIVTADNLLVLEIIEARFLEYKYIVKPIAYNDAPRSLAQDTVENIYHLSLKTLLKKL